MQTWERDLARWQAAGVVDALTADRIRSYEAQEARPAGHRWQVLVSLILGGILLGAGLLLFVAAHWDEVSPLERLSLVVGTLALLHIGAIFATGRFPGMATALHAVGTIGAGAAIAMVGQIFNIQEHWPAAILLWALCAVAGYWLLHDQFQQVCLMLLAPAWLVCEWSYRASVYRGSGVYCFRMIAVVAAVYLTAFLHSRRRAVWGILFAVAGVTLLVTTASLTEGWTGYSWALQEHPVLPFGLRIAATFVMLLMLAAGWMWERRSLLPTLVIAAMSFALPWLQTKVPMEYVRGNYTRDVPSVLAYALIAAVSVFLAWWGVRERSRALVNYGIGVFAITVAWFYFSSLMDKLGRSLGLIGLGVLFLAGGWALERMRRRLLSEMHQEVPA